MSIAYHGSVIKSFGPVTVAQSFYGKIVYIPFQATIDRTFSTQGLHALMKKDPNSYVISLVCQV